MDKEKLKEAILILKIIAGNFFLALAVQLLIIPHGLVSGGSTGLVLTLQHFTGLSFSLLTALVNIVTFLIGFYFLGKKFALTTLLSTLLYPIILQVTGLFCTGIVLTHEPIVAALLAGVLMGLGLGLVIGAGASTGGMDIPVIILNKKTGLSVSFLMYIMDSCILLSQLTFHPLESLLYGIVLLGTTTLMINQVIMMGQSAFQIFVVSNKKEAIRQSIIHDLDKGATLVHIETGYQGKETYGVMCIVSPRDLHLVQKTVHEIDPYAFMTITKIQEVNGRGFTIDRHLRS